jgi:tRNA G46 methylase TrmB
MNSNEFISYLRDYRSALLPPVEFAATHPEYVKVNWRPTESTIVEALIWRTDFPYFKQELAQTMFEKSMAELVERGQDAGKVRLLAEILWLADLAVTYMGSDPIRAWDRVTNLYDELYLPKVEAVFRTDAFFSDFAEIDLFKEIIGTRHFPDIFRQRWNMIYQFFHEGNPSTQLNRTIAKARRLYSKINLEINMRKSDLLLVISANHWSEYFIGIGRDQSEVLRAKSQFAELDPQNASVFWGDTQKLLPNISNKSIDNFLISLPYALAPLGTMEEKLSFRTLLAALPQKLTRSGTLQVLTDIDKDSMAYRELMAIAGDAGLQLADGRKSYFPNDWSDQDFIKGKDTQTLIFVPKE